MIATPFTERVIQQSIIAIHSDAIRVASIDALSNSQSPRVWISQTGALCWRPNTGSESQTQQRSLKTSWSSWFCSPRDLFSCFNSSVSFSSSSTLRCCDSSFPTILKTSLVPFPLRVSRVNARAVMQLTARRTEAVGWVDTSSQSSAIHTRLREPRVGTYFSVSLFFTPWDKYFSTSGDFIKTEIFLLHQWLSHSLVYLIAC